LRSAETLEFLGFVRGFGFDIFPDDPESSRIFPTHFPGFSQLFPGRFGGFTQA
jgi:hypothetical protein